MANVTAAQVLTYAALSATVEITRPNQTVDGDLLLLALQWEQGATLNTPPNGFTFLTGGATGATFNEIGMNLYYKHASAEPSVYSAALSSANYYSWIMVLIKGQFGSSSALDSNAIVSKGSTSTMAAGATTASSSLSLRLVFGTQYGYNAGPVHFETPAGYTDLAQITSTNIAAMVVYKNLVGSGIDAAIATMSVSGPAAITPWVTISVNIRNDPSYVPPPPAKGPPLGSLLLMGIGR
jgi:hypothetical protein